MSHPLHETRAIDPSLQLRLTAVTHRARTREPHIELIARHHFDVANTLHVYFDRIGG